MGTRRGGGVGGVRWFGTHVIEHSKHPSVLWGGGNMAEEVCISNETSPKGSWETQYQLQCEIKIIEGIRSKIITSEKVTFSTNPAPKLLMAFSFLSLRGGAKRMTSLLSRDRGTVTMTCGW